ncbi:GCN5-related N-acetyltransferase [Fibrisoma limi BUZ 3]|uniref:GCN5-related N-acetyltransferase n=1 Tax=Fibrisoma limi BUZ 3 TaxID=1185876 RepID=I2GTJ4_9BACT|nr:GNAT family N-acetyltransferase [Fibrisoma limi]CCH57223.1 GCN5-related N-acetyltransferase [Fibrisoma limi BUZ 3]
MTIRLATTEPDIRRCLPALLALRPHLTEEQALALIQLQQQEDRFQLAFVDTGDTVPAVAGYRIQHFLHSGRTLYIDDLSTLPEGRGKGYAGALLDFVIEQARQAGCQVVTLDSGHNPARYDAHRLYLKKRFNIVSHHFRLDLQ